MENFKCYTSTPTKTKQVLELMELINGINYVKDYDKPFLIYMDGEVKQLPATGYGYHDFRNYKVKEISLDDLINNKL